MSLDWKLDRWSTRSCELTPTLRLSVYQEIGQRYGPTPPWRAVVFGAKLTAKFDSYEAGREAAENAAKRHLARALKAFD